MLVAIMPCVQRLLGRSTRLTKALASCMQVLYYSSEANVDAEAYEELSKPQYEAGCEYVRELNLSSGDKGLDMGCGTGRVTKYIADIVGPDGQVVGIDPDAARIKIAQDKYKAMNHLQFHVGSTVTGFPHDNEPYYDVHVSTHAFHWLLHDEKKLYIQKAYHSLKPGGKLAVLFADKVAPQGDDQYKIIDMHPLSKDDTQELCEEVALFPNVLVRKVDYPVHFEKTEQFKRWIKASSHHDVEKKLDPAFLKAALAEHGFIVHDDGRVTGKLLCISITATKE